MMTVKTMYIDNNRHIVLWWTMMEGQQSLTLCWRSFWRWGRKRFTFTSAYKGSHNQFMAMCNLSPPRLPMIHDQQSLTRRWRSISWWGIEGIAIRLAYEGSQKFRYDWLQPIGGVISQDSWPKIVDAPLTLIFMMGQGGYCNLFCL